MSETTRRYPRTLQEAFPNDPRYSFAIIATAKKPYYVLEWVFYGALCMLVGYVLGKFL